MPGAGIGASRRRAVPRDAAPALGAPWPLCGSYPAIGCEVALVRGCSIDRRRGERVSFWPVGSRGCEGADMLVTVRETVSDLSARA